MGTVITSLDGSNGWRCGKRHASIVGNKFSESPGCSFDAGAVISLEKIGAHQAASVTGPSVVNDGFEAVAYFDAVGAFGGRDEQEDTAIVFFVSDTELFEKVVAILIDVLAFKRADSDDGHLGAGFLFELGREIFEASLGVRRNDVGEIGDVAGRVDVRNLFGISSEPKQKKNEKKLRLEKSRGPGKTLG
jgi:hypothetical protein